MVSESKKDKRIRSLLVAADEDRKQLQFYRDKFHENIKILVGRHYSDDGSEQPVPINKFALMLDVLTPMLAGKTPAAYVTTKSKAHKQTALAMQLAFPKRLKQVNYRDAARQVFAASIFSPMGIAKVGREFVRTETDEDGTEFNVTRPYVYPITIDDFVFDMDAKRWCDVQYAGDRCDVDYDEFMEAGGFEPGVEDYLEAAKNRYDHPDDERGRVAEISRGNQKKREQYRDTMSVWYIWCRHDNTVKVFDRLRDGRLLKTIEFEGPEDGPYHFLSYTDVPGQILGLAPAAKLRDVVEAINMAWNKAVDGADRQKTLYEFRDAATASLARTLPDGHTYHSNVPNNVQAVRFGGAEQTNIGMAMTADNVFDQLGYPLSLLGGMGAGSPTATQDSILQGNATRSIGQMANRVQEFHASVFEHLGNDMWDDHLFDPDMTYTPTGSRLVFTVSFAPDKRWGEFGDYDIQIVPYSMSESTPAERWRGIAQFMQTFVMNAMPYMQQQGISVNWWEFIIGYAKANGWENEVIDFMIHTQRKQMGVSDEDARKPATTTRVNERVNRSTANPRSQGMELAKMLMGGNMAAPGGNGQSGGAY